MYESNLSSNLSYTNIVASLVVLRSSQVEVVCMEGLKDVAEGIASVEEVGEGDGGICRVTSDTCYAVKCVKAEEKSLEELCEGKNCGWDVGGKAGEDFVRHLVILSIIYASLIRFDPVNTGSPWCSILCCRHAHGTQAPALSTTSAKA